jgi:hypothetical protein
MKQRRQARNKKSALVSDSLVRRAIGGRIVTWTVICHANYGGFRIRLGFAARAKLSFALVIAMPQEGRNPVGVES